ncbi:BatD family protein [Flavimarina sp. Hel_I_48]|uniref:BatD family protein n=1 Tax=Flavimarina sp. Hel_I_48 TaxID=1392488 RepID=UPI003977A2B9
MNFAYLLLFLSVGFHSLAQKVQFDATVSKNKLGVNERLRVDFEMNQDGDNFQPPSFQGFTVVGGPNQSISQQWINGKKSFSKTFSYFLAPNTTGNLKIGQAEISIAGNTYKTIPLDIEVTGAVNNPNDEAGPQYAVEDKIHLVAEVSNTKPYLNEAITVVYKLYVSPQTAVNGWNEIDAPKFADFWSQSIDEKQFKVYDGTYDGEPYRYVILRRTLLYPQKTGDLTIEPLALSLNVEVPTQRRDIFGGYVTRPEKLTVAANNRKITVKPLPEQGKPADFSGAVGNFDFNVTTTKKELKASESLNLNITASGNGNLKLFKLPKPKLPSALEVYEPEHDETINTNINGMSGSIADRYTVVPQVKGKYPIPQISFSYFDPKTDKYRTLTSEELLINVEKGPEAVTTANGDTANKKEVVASNQFRYIKTDADLEPMGEKRFFRSTAFWSLMASPLLFIPLILLANRKRREYKADVKGNRLRKADRMARKFLSEAKKNMGDQKAFYLALERCLHNYLKAKLNIQTSDMSKERIKSLLQQRTVKEETSAAFLSVLESCEFARYTPSSDVTMQKDYDKAAQVISEMDKQL